VENMKFDFVFVDILIFGFKKCWNIKIPWWSTWNSVPASLVDNTHNDLPCPSLLRSELSESNL